MVGTSKNKKNSSESIIEEQLKGLKELLHETKNKVTSLERQITNNHSELLEKIDAADKNVKKALQLANNNKIVISELRHEKKALKEKIQSDIT